MTSLTFPSFKQLIDTTPELIILDTREPSEFADGFITESMLICLDDRFNHWVANLIPSDKPLLLIIEPGMEETATEKLSEISHGQILGYLQGGFNTWKNEGERYDMVITVEADEFAMDLPFDEKLVVVDVRSENEYESGHVVDAINLPLTTMADPGSLALLEENENLYVYCTNGNHCNMAAAIMKKQGFHNLRTIVDGWEAIRQEKRIKTELSKEKLN
jgi:hydroxyacylglutathione hydrolase